MPAYNSSIAGRSHQFKQLSFRVLGTEFIQKSQENYQNLKKPDDSSIVQGEWDGNSSHECLAVCLGLGEDVSKNCTAWCQFLLVQNIAFASAKKNIKQPQGCFRMRLHNVPCKCQPNFVKPCTTMNLPKTWWKTIQGSRQSSSQRRTCFPKHRQKGPSQ